MQINRSTVTRFIAQAFHVGSYLEIGVNDGGTFNIISAHKKVGVDPKGPPATHKMTSNEYFQQNTDLFDLILVDGLHTYDQTNTDMFMSFKRLNKYGWMVVDDIHPTFPMQANPTYVQEGTIGWQGECYKAWINMRMLYPEYGFINIEGTNVGVVSRLLPSINKAPHVDVTNIDYEYFAKNKVELLNPVSWATVVAYIAIARMYIWERSQNG